MAKYDVFKIRTRAGDEKNYIEMELSILFEEGDDLSQEIGMAAEVLIAEAQDQKDRDTIQTIEQ